eukprot:COSAG02_NODE_5640_length_4163_cov_5.349902_4_plen_100_part_00
MVDHLCATAELTLSIAGCWFFRASQSFQKRHRKNAWPSTPSCTGSISTTQRWQHSTRWSVQQKSRGFAGGRTQCDCSILSRCGHRDRGSARHVTGVSNY